MEAVFKLAAIYSVVDKMTGPVKKMAGTVMSFEKMLNAGRGMKNFGARMSVEAGIISATVGQVKNSVLSMLAPYAAVEDAIAKLRTVTTSAHGSMDDALRATKKAALDWSESHMDSAVNFIEATTAMGSAGLNSVQAIAGTRAALAAARANMGEVGESAELLATLYNNMGDKARDAGMEMNGLADILTVTMQAFQIKNLGALGEGFKYAVSAAKPFGITVAEMSTVVGSLNNLGLTGGQAGTAFAATVNQMNAASKQLGFSIAKTADGGMDFIGTLQNIKDKYGGFREMTADQQEAFKKAFGLEGLRAIALMLDKTGDLKTALNDITNSAGATAAAMGTIEGTTSANAVKAMNQLQRLKIEFGEQLLGNKAVMEEILPGFIAAVKWLGNLATGFMQAHPAMSKTIVVVGAMGIGLAALVAPIMMVVGAFASGVGNIIIAITRLGQGIKWLGTTITSQSFGAKFIALKASMTGAFNTGYAAVMRCAAGMKAFALSVLRSAAAMATAAAQGIKSFVLGLVGMARQAIVTAATALPPLIASVWAFTAALLANPMTWVVLGIMALIAAIALCVIYWDDIKAAASSAWAYISSAASNALKWIEGGINGALNWLSSLLPEFMRSGSALWEAFGAGIKAAVFGPVGAVLDGLSMIRNLLPFSDAKAGPLSRLTENGRRLMATVGEGVKIEAPKLSDTVGRALDFSGRFHEGRGQEGADGRQIVVQGNVIIQVEKMDSPEGFAAAFNSLAMQLGG
jgi:TP901 family phage tail tape measure protein